MRGAQDYTVLIDGYNVIKRHAAWERLTLREARQRLVELLGRTRWPIPISRVLVVFDGQAAPRNPLRVEPMVEAASLRSTHKLQVRFAVPSADAHILHVIRTSLCPRRLLVISDDGEISRTAESYGTRRHSTQWLFQRSLPATRHHDAEPDKAVLPAATARRITEELAKRWLDSSSTTSGKGSPAQ